MSKILVFLGQAGVDNLIATLSAIGVFLAIVVGFIQTKKTIKASFEMTLKSNMIEQARELPQKILEFVRLTATTLSCYVFMYNNPENVEIKPRFYELKSQQFKVIEEIPAVIITYGSEKSIKLFNEFYYAFKEAKEKGGDVEFNEWIKNYYSLPLLVSLVKKDVTGEIVNPAVIFKYVMPWFHKFEPAIIEDVINYNNKYVNDFKLPSEFLWDVNYTK